MDTQQIEKLLTHAFLKSPVSFLGVFASDRLPLPSTIEMLSPCCYVANTDASGEEGAHWVAFFHSDGNSLDFFDSFGESPYSLGFYVEKITKTRYNQVQVQSLLSDVCAHYCIFFLIHRAHGVPMRNIIAKFKSFKYSDSDSYVANFIQKLEHELKK
ncbi:MAG: hypothetical protein FD188_3298 [Ignavibacteria bacterium]|nr:MAG: hypothetical protein FD188_3298 [Ignavibacteria bacterium]